MVKHIVAITGAGISAESGISTYRDDEGLWKEFDHEEVASPEAWKKDREKVLAFWNQRRHFVEGCSPNSAHLSLKDLESHCRVTIITQNIDDLHEKAGSKDILHLHGELMKSRSSVDPKIIYDSKGKDIEIGMRCSKNSQLRPHVVWFGEHVPLFRKAQEVVRSADIILVVGCSLEVYPAAALIPKEPKVPVYVVNKVLDCEDEFNIRDNATTGVAQAIERILGKRI